VRTDRASRLIRAPLTTLYRAFIEPEALIRWLPPEGMTGEMLEFDARAGGGYTMALRHDDEEHAGKTSAHEDVVAVRFLKLVPGKLIVQAADFVSEDPAFAGTMTMIWEFEAAGDGARVAITCENVPQGIARRDHVAGLKSSLANLAALVEGAGQPDQVR
jgi:uncharacterized protein YndB with AHSA1/START domain